MVKLVMTAFDTVDNKTCPLKRFDCLFGLYCRQFHAVTSTKKAVLLTSLSGWVLPDHAASEDIPE
jgi:hypothetical protein